METVPYEATQVASMMASPDPPPKGEPEETKLNPEEKPLETKVLGTNPPELPRLDHEPADHAQTPRSKTKQSPKTPPPTDKSMAEILANKEP